MREIHTKIVNVKTDLVAANALSEKRAETLKSVLHMVERARCEVCMGKILEGHMMKCKTPLCGECGRSVNCPCSLPGCKPVYTIRAADYMSDMVWMMELIDTSILEGAHDDTDVKKAINDYMDEAFEARSVLHRASPEL
jgi:hypothetical protein